MLFHLEPWMRVDWYTHPTHREFLSYQDLHALLSDPNVTIASDLLTEPDDSIDGLGLSALRATHDAHEATLCITVYGVFLDYYESGGDTEFIQHTTDLSHSWSLWFERKGIDTRTICSESVARATFGPDLQSVAIAPYANHFIIVLHFVDGSHWCTRAPTRDDWSQSMWEYEV